MTETDSASQSWNFPEHREGIRKFRKSGGVTLTELAFAANLSKSTLSRFERGKSDLTVRSWAKLSNAVQNLPAKRRAIAGEAELRLNKGLSIGLLGELLGKHVQLCALAIGPNDYYQRIAEDRKRMALT
jgi:transcriptional regulator with XRE-family HTH domain